MVALRPLYVSVCRVGPGPHRSYHGPPGQYFTPASYLILRSRCLWVMAGERRMSPWHLYATRACYRLQLPVFRKLRTFRTGSDYLEAIRFPRTRSSDPFCARCRQILTHLPPYISCPWKLVCCYTKQYRRFIAARGVNIVASRCWRFLSQIVIWFNFLSNNANVLSVDIYG